MGRYKTFPDNLETFIGSKGVSMASTPFFTQNNIATLIEA